MNVAILSYEDDYVIQVLAQNLDITYRKAKNLFRDTVKFLFLCSQSDESLAPPRKIDTAWHDFITCTESYKTFSDKLGVFVNHRPAINGVVPGVPGTLQELHLRTKALALHTFGVLSSNFRSGVDSTKWCCSKCSSTK